MRGRKSSPETASQVSVCPNSEETASDLAMQETHSPQNLNKKERHAMKQWTRRTGLPVRVVVH